VQLDPVRVGRTSAITLSTEDVITLAQSSQRLQNHILRRRSRPGAVPVPITEARNIALTEDIHESQVHVVMIDPFGARTHPAPPIAVP
jgi:hypothetical protein